MHWPVWTLPWRPWETLLDFKHNSYMITCAFQDVHFAVLLKVPLGDRWSDLPRGPEDLNYSRNRCQGEKTLGIKDINGMKAKIAPDWLKCVFSYESFGWSCNMGVTAQHCREWGERQSLEQGHWLALGWWCWPGLPCYRCTTDLLMGILGCCTQIWSSRDRGKDFFLVRWTRLWSVKNLPFFTVPWLVGS